MKSSPAARYAIVTRVSGMRYRRNMRSMRCVTRKPPAMLIVASRIAAAPRMVTGRRRRAADLQHAADHDDAADRVGHAHQRRVQRRRDVPHHLPADDAGEREHRQVRQERRRRDQAEADRARPRATIARIGPPTPRFLRRLARAAGASFGAAAFGFGGSTTGGRAGGGHITSPSRSTSAPRTTSSSRSRWKWLAPPRSASRCVRLLPNSRLAVGASRLGRSV